MKFLALFIALLGFAPTILDQGLSSGCRAPAPTHVFPTKTYDPSYALNAGKVVLRVPATSVAEHHNNAGQSGSTVSISTDLHVTSDLPFASIRDTIVSLNRRQLQYQWPHLHDYREIDYGWVIHGFHFLLSLLTVGTAIVRERRSYRRSLQSEPAVNVSTALERRDTVKCWVPPMRANYLVTFPNRGLIEAGPRIPIAAPTPLEKAHQIISPRLPVQVLQITGWVDSFRGTADHTVALKQPYRIVAWITLFSVEGFLIIDPCLTNSICGTTVQWTLAFQPRDRYCPTPSPTQTDVHVATTDCLLNILYHGISTYHPWVPQPARIFEVPGDVLTEANEVHPNATVIIAGPIPVPVIHLQTVPDTELETSLESTLFKDLTATYGIDAEEYNMPVPRPASAPPRLASGHEAQMSEPADQAANGTYGIGTEDYNAPVPRPASAPPRLRSIHEASPADLAVTSTYSYGIDTEEYSAPVPRPASAPPRLAFSYELQTRADIRMQSVEGHVEDQPRASGTGEDGSAAHAQAENESQAGNKRTKRGGAREARRKRLLASKAVESPEAGPSGSN